MNKSLFLKRYGYTQQNWQQLEQDILNSTHQAEIIDIIPSGWGLRLKCSNHWQTPTKQTIQVITIWQVDQSNQNANFVTLYPNKTKEPPHAPKLMAILVLTLLGTFCMVAASVTIWSLTYLALDLFDTFEAALYFALVSFTTLGFGDVLLPDDWRLLGGFTAANGFFAFGQITALLIETMRSIRVRQRDSIS